MGKKKRVKWAHPLKGRTIKEAIADVFEVLDNDIWRNEGFYSSGGASWGVYDSPKAPGASQGKFRDLHCFQTMRDCLRFGFTIEGDEIVAKDHPRVCDRCGEDKDIMEMYDAEICKDCARFAVEIGSLLTTEGRVGEPTGRAPVVREHRSAMEAMVDLKRAIESGEGRAPGEMVTYFIRMPGGRRLPLDAAYEEAFGVPPVRRDNEENLYPKLEVGNVLSD